MKIFLLFITSLLLCVGCDRTNEDQLDKDDSSILEKNRISDGHYMGYFVFENKNYWCSIDFFNNKYEEWPSGGVMYQKGMGCLTSGRFNINEAVITFNLDTYKHPSLPCDFIMVLPGEYKINLISLTDSIVFSKEVEKDIFKYHLKRINEKR